MTDATTGAPAPKKRSLFKRAAWQDAAKKEDEDMFSHSNEFKDIVAEENRRKEEAKRKAEREEKRVQAEKPDKKGKRRKVSAEFEEPVLVRSDSGESSRLSRSQTKACACPCLHVDLQLTVSDEAELPSPQPHPYRPRIRSHPAMKVSQSQHKLEIREQNLSLLI